MIQLPEFCRRSLPADFDAADPAAAAAVFDELEARPLEDRAALETWLADLDELLVALREERDRRLVASTCDTRDATAQDAYRTFIETVEPHRRRRTDALDDKLLGSPFVAELDRDRLGQFLDAVRARRRLFRKENVALQVEQERYQNDYQRLIGGTLVSFEGEERPLPRMRVFAQDQDRARREGAWRAATGRVLQERDRCEDLFERLVAVRTRMARNAGLPDFEAYRFVEWRRCYTPEDCERFHAAVEARVLPLRRELQRARREALGLAALRPWDLDVDPAGRPPLRPFEGGGQLVALARRLLSRVDPLFGERVAYMERRGLLDLESRPGKAPGGYMCDFPEQRLPFIFMNASGVQADVNTMLHEGGHAFHVFETRSLEPNFNRGSPTEFAEVASMAMEHLGLEFAAEVYGEEDARRARREHLARVIVTFCWVATIDSFQHRIYTRPDHTPEERRALWLECHRRFLGDVDHSGLEEAEAYRWHLQGHLFTHALYYIEYALAELGALQVWRNFRRDPAAAVAAYRCGLALGHQRSVPELFRAAGAEFDLGEETLGGLMDMVAAEIDRLG
ncbi:MAG: M3 family oligoendopeptidase [Planctomycetota bacterium]